MANKYRNTNLELTTSREEYIAVEVGKDALALADILHDDPSLLHPENFPAICKLISFRLNNLSSQVLNSAMIEALATLDKTLSHYQEGKLVGKKNKVKIEVDPKQLENSQTRIREIEEKHEEIPLWEGVPNFSAFQEQLFELQENLEVPDFDLTEWITNSIPTY